MSDLLMKFTKYILISLLCLSALLGLVGQFSNVPFLPSPQEVALRQQMMLERWAESLTRKAAGDALPEESPAVLTPKESYDRSIELLSAGRQIEAEEVITEAVKNNLDDANLLFAKAVLERSRWDKYTARLWFSLARRKGSHTYIADASALSLRLDSRKGTASDLLALVQLSDANPDDIYLLWLSAIQCREQKNGPLGRQQYEKLLSKFTVGPVLLHQTYANILSEILGDHEAALKHRYIAVSLEAKGWTLQGLANTLTYLKRYDEACAVWARAVQVSPDDGDYWGGWGWTLRMMGRYEEALDKHKEACRIDPSSAYNFYNAGWCLEKLARYPEMVECHRKAAELNYVDAMVKLGYCLRDGLGVEKNLQESVKWFQMGAKSESIEATYRLAEYYEKGNGVEKDLKRAENLFRRAVELDAGDVNALNFYAWFLATCNEESLRNCPEAVRLAELSVAKEEQIFNLDTLAVACDRNGQYAKAVEAQKRLIAFRQKQNPDKEVPAGMLKRLEEFERKAAEQ
jgi:tetratricopeptide (TPR) repeat protein